MAESNGDVKTQQGETNILMCKSQDLMQIEINSSQLALVAFVDLTCLMQKTSHSRHTLPETPKMGSTSRVIVSSTTKRRKSSRQLMVLSSRAVNCIGAEPRLITGRRLSGDRQATTSTPSNPDHGTNTTAYDRATLTIRVGLHTGTGARSPTIHRRATGNVPVLLLSP